MTSILNDIAKAKLNLTLHVGQVCADGYHPLFSHVVFSEHGDHLSLNPQDELELVIEGPFAASLLKASETKVSKTGEADNLIFKAVQWAQNHYDMPKSGLFTLTKNLPVASGIGGGSADAAAALRLMDRLNGYPKGHMRDKFRFMARELGADIPVCYLSGPSLIEGIGERVSLLGFKDKLTAVLVNPGLAVSTGAVFREFDNLTAQDRTLKLDKTSQIPLLEQAQKGVNDLQSIAVELCPQIGEVLEVLEQTQGVQLARMSGSGATCFALYDNESLAQHAVKRVKLSHPKWWCVATYLN